MAVHPRMCIKSPSTLTLSALLITLPRPKAQDLHLDASPQATHSTSDQVSSRSEVTRTASKAINIPKCRLLRGKQVPRARVQTSPACRLRLGPMGRHQTKTRCPRHPTPTGPGCSANRTGAKTTKGSRLARFPTVVRCGRTYPMGWSFSQKVAVLEC